MQRLTPLKTKTGKAGQALPEYGLIIALMAIVLFVIFQMFGQIISDFFMDFSGTFTGFGG